MQQIEQEIDRQQNVFLPGIVSFLLLLSDLVAILASFFLAITLRTKIIPMLGGRVIWQDNFTILFLGTAYIIVLFGFFKLYPGYGLSALTELEKLIIAITLVFGFLGIIIYVFKINPDFPRSLVLLSWGFCIGLIPIMRFIARNIMSKFPWYGKPLLYFIENNQDSDVLHTSQRSRRIGWRPLAVYILDNTDHIERVSGIPVVTKLSDAISVGKRYKIDTVLISGHLFDNTNLYKDGVIRDIANHFRSIVLMSSKFEYGPNGMVIRDLEGFLGIELQFSLFDPLKKLIKRIIDLIGSFLLLLSTLPIWIILCILIRIDSKGPIFYKQIRIGQDSKPFEMIKFRTMVVNADSMLQEYLSSNSSAQKEWSEIQKLSFDPRITRIGRWLRKYSLDELPQFLNVISGDMSIFGPRAVTEKEVEKYGDYASIILKTKPGITGWWQVMGRNETTWEQRTRFEVYYVSNWSLLMDYYIAIKTIWVIVSGQGR